MQIRTVGIHLAKKVFRFTLSMSAEKLRCASSYVESNHRVSQIFRRALSEWKPVVVLTTGAKATGLRSDHSVVRLMAPQFVKTYIKSYKTDAADAEAISRIAVRGVFARQHMVSALKTLVCVARTWNHQFTFTRA